MLFGRRQGLWIDIPLSRQILERDLQIQSELDVELVLEKVDHADGIHRRRGRGREEVDAGTRFFGALSERADGCRGRHGRERWGEMRPAEATTVVRYGPMKSFFWVAPNVFFFKTFFQKTRE